VQPVGQAAAGVDTEELRRPPAADGVEVDDHEVLRAIDQVVAHQRAADQPGLRVQRGDADIQRTPVEQHLDPRFLWRRATGVRVLLDEAAVDRGTAPGRMVEPAIEHQALAGGQRHGTHRVGRLRPRRGKGRQQQAEHDK
jgi:hypothetical protein